jgi:hypothetical protein
VKLHLKRSNGDSLELEGSSEELSDFVLKNRELVGLPQFNFIPAAPSWIPNPAIDPGIGIYPSPILPDYTRTDLPYPIWVGTETTCAAVMSGARTNSASA